MATVIYNGIYISHVQVNGMSRQPVLNESAEYLYTHVTLDISGIISPKTGAYGLDENDQIVPMPGESAASTDALIRHYLLQPRRQFIIMMVDNRVLLVSPARRSDGPGYYSCDCNSGPIPKLHNITRIDGDHLFRVNWSCETWIRECRDGDYNATPALLSNRFAQTHSIDDSFMTTIRTIGQAFFRTDLLDNANEVCDTYRNQCFPPVPLGFKRMSIQVAVTLSRNVLTYDILDQQRFFDIGDTNPLIGGSGIADIDAQYSTSTISNSGGVVGGQSMAEMAVRIKGVKESSHWHMIQKAFEVAGAKLPLNRMPQSGILSHLSLTENLTSRDITLRAQMILPPSNIGKLGILNTDILRIDNIFPDKNTFGKNPAPYNDGGSRGSYTRKVFVAKLKAACDQVSKPLEGRDTPPNPSSDYSSNLPVDPVITYTDVVPNFKPNVSYDQIKSFHTDYKLDIKTHRRSHRRQVPIAKDPGANSGSGLGSPVDSPSTQQGDSSGDPVLVPDCEIVHLAYPTSEMVVTWTAERVGEPPKYPNPFNTDKNLVLIEDKIQPASPELLPDGVNLVWRISGEYRFAMLSSRGAGDRLPVGALPLWDKTYEDSFVDPKYSVNGIIGPKESSA